MAGPFLGVELPDKFETNSSESAPEVSDVGGDTDKAPEETQDTSDKPDGSSSDKPATAQVVEKPADLLDLDKHERVRFKGREYSVQELRDSFLRHEDYTRKVQQSNEVAKYARGFEEDLQTLIENPARLGEFKKIYPKAYVRAAEKVLENLATKGAATSQASHPETQPSQRAALDPEIQRQIEEFSEFKQNFESKLAEANVQRDQETLNGWFTEFANKFPEADQEVVNTRAYFQSVQKESEGKSLTKADVEKLFKADHEAREARFTERVRSLNTKQKAVARKSQDMGGGGGVPASPSQKPKTFKEANALMEKDLESGRLS